MHGEIWPCSDFWCFDLILDASCVIKKDIWLKEM